MTTPGALSEIIFFAEALESDDVFNSSVYYRDGPTVAPALPFVSPTMASSGAQESLSPHQAGMLCLNLMQRPATLMFHRNIAAWVAVTLAAIGVIGNIFSLFVLFRTEPRSPTDVYMMHLAAYDVAYEIFFAVVIASRTWWTIRLRATFSFVLVSLVCRPLIDLFSNLATVVVTVFALERLLAVYRPLKTLNTSANKMALWIALATATVITFPDFFEFGMTALEPAMTTRAPMIPSTIKSLLEDNGIPAALSNLTKLLSAGGGNDTAVYDAEMVVYDEDGGNIVSMAPEAVMSTPSILSSSPTVLYCYHRTEFSQTQFYSAYVYFYTIVFTFIPLILLIAANGFLIWGVTRASKTREVLTKGQVSRPRSTPDAFALPATTAAAAVSQCSAQHLHSSSGKARSQQADQQRLTLMLVMIVLIFTVCQLPIAILAIYSLLNKEMTGNVSILVIYSNILVVVFSTTNFAFYSAFSRRFRQTLTEMVWRFKRTLDRRRSSGDVGYNAGGANNNYNASRSNRYRVSRDRSPADFAMNGSSAVRKKSAIGPGEGNDALLKPQDRAKASSCSGLHLTVPDEKSLLSRHSESEVPRHEEAIPLTRVVAENDHVPNQMQAQDNSPPLPDVGNSESLVEPVDV